MKSPMARTKELLRLEGYEVDDGEKWNPFARKKRDLYGCIDLVAIHPRRFGVLGVQTTTGDHHAERREKSLEEPRLMVWLEAGNRFEVLSWSTKWGRHGGRGKFRDIWVPRREEITWIDIINHRARPQPTTPTSSAAASPA